MSQFIEMFNGKTPNSKLRDWVDTNIVKVKRAFKEDDTIEYIDISSVDNTSNEIATTTTYLLKNAPSRAQQCVRKGDILLSTVRPNLKNIGVNHLDKENLVASTGFCILRPKKGLSQLIIATIMSDDFTNKMTFVAKGTNYPAFYDYDALDYPVYSPNVEELSKVTSLYKQADKSKFIGFKSQFIEMFGEEQKISLGKICLIQKGATITRNEVTIGSIPVVAGGQEPSCYHNEANRNANMITISASGAYAGYVNYWEIPIFASDCNTISPKDTKQLDIIFLYNGLKAMQKEIYSLQKGGAQPHVYGKDLHNLLFPFPPFEHQQEFSDIVKQADKSKYIN